MEVNVWREPSTVEVYGLKIVFFVFCLRGSTAAVCERDRDDRRPCFFFLMPGIVFWVVVIFLHWGKEGGRSFSWMCDLNKLPGKQSKKAIYSSEWLVRLFRFYDLTCGTRSYLYFVFVFEHLERVGSEGIVLIFVFVGCMESTCCRAVLDAILVFRYFLDGLGVVMEEEGGGAEFAMDNLLPI